MSTLRANRKVFVLLTPYLVIVYLYWTLGKHDNSLDDFSSKFNKLRKDSPQIQKTNPDGLTRVDRDKNLTNDLQNSRQDAQEARNCSLNIMLEPCKCSRNLQVTNCAANDPDTAQTNSICGNWATLRGPGQKVVSFSLDTSYPGETHSRLEEQLERVKEVYPGWVVRVYMDQTNAEELDWACSLACKNTNLDFCNASALPVFGDRSKSYYRTWKYSVLGDPLVDYFIVRNNESPILQRELDAVAQWLESGKCFHVMRDNKAHGVPMLPGTWGGCGFWEPEKGFAALKNILVTHGNTRYADQQVLWSHVWPWINTNALVHDSYTCLLYKGSVPFPSKRENNTFVGMTVDPQDGEADGVHDKCPLECRPQEHQDWEYC